MKYFLSILAAVAMFVNVNAQDRSRNVWCFGDSVELDFNSGSPVSVSGSAMSAFEGCSSVADKTTGALLFYTDGISVWDSTNNIMPSNTQSLGGGFYAATQSALIVPVPGSTTQYYIFTVDFQGGVDFFFSGTGGVSYSIIDMSLNGGLGDVLQQPQILTTPTCEKICATKMPNNAGYWLVTHQYNSKKFFSYAITASGIGAAVTSNLGITIQDQGLNGAEAIGYMKISPDGSKIAVAHDYYYHTVQVFNFNNVTGLITGNVLSDNTLSTYSLSSFTYSGPYGLSFSPNSKLLYVTAEGDSSVYQYNLAAGNSAAVLASRNVVGVATAPFALQLAPDLKVYVIDDGTGYLDRIDSPNVYGVGCNFTIAAVQISYGTEELGLPDFIENINTPVNDTLTYANCSGDTSIVFLDTTLSNSPTYLWSFGDTASGVSNTSTAASPTHNFSTSGTYHVTLKINTGADSFTIAKNISVHNSPPVIVVGANVAFCDNDSVQIPLTAPDTLQYLWSPQIGLSCFTCRNPFASPDSTTEYHVQGTDAFGCIANDSIKVSVHTGTPIVLTSSGNTICSGDSAQICAPSGNQAYLWNVNADTASCIYAKNGGNYYVTVTEPGGCTAESNHVSITTYAAQQVQFGANGDTLISHNGVTYQWILNGTPIQGATSSTYVATETGNYSVQVSDTNGCYETSSSNLITITGVEALTGNEWIKVYPNPSTNGSWQLAAGVGLIGSSLEIFDDNGRLIYKSEIRNQRSTLMIDVAHGVYTLKVTYGNSSYNLKLVRL